MSAKKTGYGTERSAAHRHFEKRTCVLPALPRAIPQPPQRLRPGPAPAHSEEFLVPVSELLLRHWLADRRGRACGGFRKC